MLYNNTRKATEETVTTNIVPAGSYVETNNASIIVTNPSNETELHSVFAERAIHNDGSGRFSLVFGNNYIGRYGSSEKLQMHISLQDAQELIEALSNLLYSEASVCGRNEPVKHTVNITPEGVSLSKVK